MSDSTKQTYMRGAAILAATAIISKIVSGLYKIPLFSMLDDETVGYFQIAYTVYMLLIALSTAGIPVALSRLVSSANALGNRPLARRYFNIALPSFALIGLVLSLLVYRYADTIAANIYFTPNAAAGIRVLSPAIFFGCVVGVYRGYTQGHNQMLPTAVSQLFEVVSKAALGLILAWYLISNGFKNPAVSAGANAGITVGLGISIPVLIYFKRKIDRTYRLDCAPHIGALMRRQAVLAQILKVSIPIALSSTFISLITAIDTIIVKNRLQSAAGFGQKAADALFGIYSKGLSLLVLSSALIMPIAISIIPVIAAAITKHQHASARNVTDSSLKITNILAMPAGVGISVLAYPIYTVLFSTGAEAAAIGTTILSMFGIASYFICMQLLTTALLQANGRERVPILSFAVGGLGQIIVDYILVGNPDINILGSPVGTLTCYITITVINLLFLAVKVKSKPDVIKTFIKPLLCTAVMGVAARAVYELLFRFVSDPLGGGRMAMIVSMAVAIIAAVIVYVILIIATKTISREDMRYIPKGDKLAKLLKIK